jgi:hypothetical protein
MLVLLIVNGQINMLGDMYAFGLLGAFSLTCLGLDIIRARERRARRADRTLPPPASDQQTMEHVTSLNPLPPAFSQSEVLHPVNGVHLAPQGLALKRWWQRLDFWLGIFTTALAMLAWIISLFSKPLGTAFGGSVVLVGMTVAIINYIRQGSTLVLPTALETRFPGSVLAVLMDSGKNNEQVIKSALKAAIHTQPVIFLYLSDYMLERSPSPFEIVDPYLEDMEAKEAFRQAERLARREGVQRRFVYQSTTPKMLEYVWRFVQPLDVVIPEALVAQTQEINPDRVRYELTPNGKVVHLVKHW